MARTEVDSEDGRSSGLANSAGSDEVSPTSAVRAAEAGNADATAERAELAAPAGCRHPEPWVRLQDGSVSCRTCGTILVDQTVERSGEALETTEDVLERQAGAGSRRPGLLGRISGKAIGVWVVAVGLLGGVGQITGGIDAMRDLACDIGVQPACTKTTTTAVAPEPVVVIVPTPPEPTPEAPPPVATVPSVDIVNVMYRGGPDEERVVLVNTTDEAIDMSNWQLFDKQHGGAMYTFDVGFELPAGREAWVWTGSGEDLVTGANIMLFAGKGNAYWNDDKADTATLKNAEENVVDTFSYDP